jgi:hypothetical protein
MDYLAFAVSLVAGVDYFAQDVRNLDGELGRFPPPVILSRYMSFANDHWAWLVAQRNPNADLSLRLRHAEREARQRRVLRAYSTLLVARDAKDYRTRRRAADSLREEIGQDAYNFGRLPMPLPVMERPPDQ